MNSEPRHSTAGELINRDPLIRNLYLLLFVRVNKEKQQSNACTVFKYFSSKQLLIVLIAKHIAVRVVILRARPHRKSTNYPIFAPRRESLDMPPSVLLNEATDTDDDHRWLLSVPISLLTCWQQLQTGVACGPAACAMKQDYYNTTVVQFFSRTISTETYAKQTANLVGCTFCSRPRSQKHRPLTRQSSRGMASLFEDDPTEPEAQIVRGLQTGSQLKIWG